MLFGDFGGISVADSLCNDLAFNAQLPGTYKAWLSEFDQSPVEMFAATPGAFILPNGPIVAHTWEQLLSGQLLAPINLNEFGAGIDLAPALGCVDHAVWTGTTNTGLPSEPNCAEWTSANGNAMGLVGDAASKSDWSDAQCLANCNTPLPVYCVQQ